jgi:hypothetical protein
MGTVFSWRTKVGTVPRDKRLQSHYYVLRHGRKVRVAFEDLTDGQRNAVIGELNMRLRLYGECATRQPTNDGDTS